MLDQQFQQLLLPYASPQEIHMAWKEIAKAYNQPNRKYHNLTHLHNMLEELLPVKEKLNDWETLMCAVFYHDIVYNVLKKNNEAKSAALASKRLSALGYPHEKIQWCTLLINATKAHLISESVDINFLLDADLSVLGKDEKTYQQYCRSIREEYNIYPDFMYNPGRKKVLEHFLQMPHIYKTEWFSALYEKQAKINLQYEYATL